MQDVPGPYEEEMHQTDDQQSCETAPIQSFEIHAALFHTLRLKIEAKPEQECEQGVRLVEEQPVQDVEERKVESRGRQGEQLLLGRHDGYRGKHREVDEEHTEQRHAAQHVHDLDALCKSDGCRFGGQYVNKSPVHGRDALYMAARHRAAPAPRTTAVTS
jgi:hypothetical protein